MPANHMKYFVKKNTSHIVKNEKHKIKNKTSRKLEKDFKQRTVQDAKITLKILRHNKSK